MKYGNLVFWAGYDFGKERIKYRHLSEESHDVGLEFSAFLNLRIKNFNTFQIVIYDIKDVNQENIVKVGKKGVLSYCKDLDYLKGNIDIKTRYLLELDLLMESIEKLIKKFEWEREPFEKAYTETKEKIMREEELLDFFSFFLQGYKYFKTKIKSKREWGLP